MEILSKFKKIDFKIKRLLSNSNYSGNYKSIFRGKGLEWSEFREYEIGEDSSKIDWLVSAREQKLLTKKFEEEKETKIYFIIELSESLNFGFEKVKLDSLIETFLYLGLSGIENHDKVGGVILKENKSFFIKETKNKADFFNFYKLCLNDFGKESGKKTLNEGINFFNKIKTKNSIFFILSDKEDYTINNSLKVLALKNKCFYINIFDSFENSLETNNKNSGIFGLLSLNKESIYIDNLSKEKKEEYKKERGNEMKKFSVFLNNIGVKNLKIDEKSKIFKELVNFLI